MTRSHYFIIHALIFFSILALFPQNSSAIPVFARKYNLSCSTCHAAFPKLNEFGQHFIDSNYRLPNWKDNTVTGGDDMLALPNSVPFAIRAQVYAQQREAGNINVQNGSRTASALDLQAPYLIKLLSSAPLSEHISYYFYGILAEKGDNGNAIIEDAWISHDDLFGTGIKMMAGQFQVSDIMFPRETRLTFQDFMPYRAAGITYERGLLFDYSLKDIDLSLGVVNGNGIDFNKTITESGLKRADHTFDNNNDKSVFMRIGTQFAGVDTGLFIYSGQQKSRTLASAGVNEAATEGSKQVTGIDLSTQIGNNTYIFAQWLNNRWNNFFADGKNRNWQGGFIGVDYVYNKHWTYSLLYNYIDAGDLKNTDTVYEGLAMNDITLTASYYFMRNVKAVVEMDIDLQPTTQKSGLFYTGHLASDNKLLAGFDVAF